MQPSQVLIVLTVLTTLCSAGVDEHKERMLKENRTVKKRERQGGVCEECQLLVRSVHEAMKDGAKMDELKGLLKMLVCSQAGVYEQVCKEIVDRLDTVAHEIEPFLKDPEAVCKKLKLCGNRGLERLAAARSNGVLLDDVMCDECEFAVNELKTLLEEKGIQEEIKDFIHNYVCRYLGQYAGDCDELAEQFLPELFEQLETLLQNSKQLCTDLGLCSGTRRSLNDDMTDTLGSFLLRGQPLYRANSFGENSVVHKHLPSNHNLNRWNSFFRLLGRLQTSNGVKIACFECKTLMDAYIRGLQGGHAQRSMARQLRTGLCKRMPHPFTINCVDLLNVYMQPVVEVAVAAQNTQQICTALRLCTPHTFREVTRVKAEDRESIGCQSCKALTDYLKNELSDPTLVDDITRGLNFYVCQNLPEQVHNLCENVVKTYVPDMISTIQIMLDSNTICKDDLHMCTDELLQTINL